ncbi:MAG: RNA polymerase sigma factor [Acidimicrobiales bacterium]|nr:RNA polymerase sigma factor [Acidimicrobiales bacterium]
MTPRVLDHADDATLVAAARSGDEAALDVLLRRHYPRIHALCRRLTGDDHDALDASQEALLAVTRGLARFDGRAAFTTWLYRVTTNACLDELRRRQRRPTVLDDVRLEHRASRHTDHGPGLAEAVTDRLAVDEALAGLPPEFRAAVVLRDLCGLDYAEIADVLGVPPGTVRSRIARGRAAVAAALGNPGDTGERRRERT